MTNDIGRRIAELRARRGMTQEELAEAAGISISVVKKLEQGGTSRMESYTAIARALGVVTLMFVPRSGALNYAETDDARQQMLTDMRKAIMPPIRWDGSAFRYDLDSDDLDVDRLSQALRNLVTAYHGNRCDFVGQAMPAVIRAAHAHVDGASGGQREGALRLRSCALQLAGRYLILIREHDLALSALREALKDAVEVSDRVLALNVMGNQARVMIRQGWFTEVEQLCISAASEIESSNAMGADELAARGWLLLRASAAAARNNSPKDAEEYLERASAIAEQLGTEHVDAGHMYFGPLTVATKRTENALLAGRPDRALEHAAHLPRNVGSMAPAGWQQHLLHCADALVLTKQHEKALELLDGLRSRAPEWLHHQRYARDIMRSLLKTRKRTFTDQQRDLADFLSLEM